MVGLSYSRVVSGRHLMVAIATSDARWVALLNQRQGGLQYSKAKANLRFEAPIARSLSAAEAQAAGHRIGATEGGRA